MLTDEPLPDDLDEKLHIASHGPEASIQINDLAKALHVASRGYDVALEECVPGERHDGRCRGVGELHCVVIAGQSPAKKAKSLQ